MLQRAIEPPWNVVVAGLNAFVVMRISEAVTDGMHSTYTGNSNPGDTGTDTGTVTVTDISTADAGTSTTAGTSIAPRAGTGTGTDKRIPDRFCAHHLAASEEILCGGLPL